MPGEGPEGERVVTGDVLTAAAVGYVFSLFCRAWKRQAERAAADGAALIAAAEAGQAPEPQGRCRACGVVCHGSMPVDDFRPRWPGWEECSVTPGLWHYTGSRRVG